MSFNDILTKLNDVVYTYIPIILLVGVGVYFTIQTKGAQFRLFKDGLKSMMQPAERKKDMLICSSTAMMLLMSGIEGKSGVLDGIPYVQAAISANVGEWGIHFITFSIFAFAFTSLIGNYCYAESNILFIKNSKAVLNVFRVTCLVAIFLGAQADFSLVWNLADITMGFMAIVNIIAIFLLGKVALKVLNNYEKQKKEGRNPVFYEDEVGLTGTVWKREK